MKKGWKIFWTVIISLTGAGVVFCIIALCFGVTFSQFEKAYPDAFKANVKMPPAGHFGDAEKEIGRVCVQLASPDFKYMNGETITLEGGMGQRP